MPRINYYRRRSVVRTLCGALFLAAISMCSAAKADPCDNMDAVLVPSLRTESRNSTLWLAFMKVINQASFDEVKKHGDLTIITGNWAATGNYDDWKTHRDKLLSDERFFKSESESRSLLETGLPEYVVNAWRDVRLACINRNSSGIKAALAYADANSVAVIFSWYPPPGAARPGVVGNSSSLRGASLQGARAGKPFPLGHIFQVNSSETFEYQRQSGQDFRLVANVNGTTAHLNVDDKDISTPSVKRVVIELMDMELSSDQGFHDTVCNGLGDADFKIWARAEAIRADGTQDRAMAGNVSKDSGGNARLHTVTEGSSVSHYPLDGKTIVVEVRPDDIKVNVTLSIALERGKQGGGGCYTTSTDSLIIALDPAGRSAGDQKSTALKGTWGRPDDPERFRGVISYRITYSKPKLNIS